MRTGLLIRFAVMGLLLLALWNPPLPWQQGAVDLFLLLDDSESMPPEFQLRSWRSLLDQIARLPAGSRFTLIRFGGNSVTELESVTLDEPLLAQLRHADTPPRRLPLNRQSSNLETALRTALEQMEPGRFSRVLLISDGVENVGEIGALIGSEATPLPHIAWLAPQDERTPQDLWIESVNLPRYTKQGEEIPLSVNIAANYAADANLRISLDDRSITERTIPLSAQTTRTLQLALTPPPPGVHLLELVVEAQGDRIDQNNRFVQVIIVSGPGVALWIGPAGAGQPIRDNVITGLQQQGWNVITLPPQQLAAQAALLQQATVVVLDNVAQWEMPERGWQELKEAVRTQGRGLIVLGGEHAFGSGGYHRSEFESLLPVISESALTQPPVALQFVIDKSGSMAQPGSQGSRIALSRQAVIETARGLQSGDEVGVIDFDSLSRVLLPLGKYPQPVPAIEQVWALAASGGTQLLPALEQALDALVASRLGRRILVVVTDGYFGDIDLTSIRKRIVESSIEAIMLAVGGDADLTGLQRLVQGTSGKVLQIDDIARLPMLMRSEVEQRRSSIATGPTQPVQPNNIPFLREVGYSWPALQGYSVTRIAQGSNLLLQAPNGDPLLAERTAGSGRVLAFLPGIGAWTQDWTDWPYWHEFVGEMVAWSAGLQINPRLHIQHQSRAGQIKLQLELLSTDGEWLHQKAVNLTVTDPAGRVQTLVAEPVAAGRYRVEISAALKGLYQVNASSGELRLYYPLVHQPVGEFTRPLQVASALQRAVAAGRVAKRSLADKLVTDLPASRSGGSRTALILLAMLLYLLVIVREREISLPWLPMRARDH